MAKYKIWLTVKDRYGNLKEIDGGNVDIALNEGELETVIDSIKENIPVYVPEVTPDNVLKFTLTDNVADEELKFDIDKTNDWDQIDGTTGSSYVWEPMK